MGREQLDVAERGHPHLDARAAQIFADDPLLDDAGPRGQPVEEHREVRLLALERHGHHAVAQGVALRGVAAGGQAHEVDLGVAGPGHALVELDHGGGRSGTRGPQSGEGGHDVVDGPDVVDPHGVRDPCRGEGLTGAGLRAEGHVAGVGAVHGDAEQQGEVPFEPGRVVGEQVREGRVGNEGTDAGDHPRPGQQLLGQRGGRGVADGDQRQPGPGVARDDAREQGQVVLDDRRVDGHRRHVDQLEPGLSEQQQHEQEALLQCLVGRTGTGHHPFDGHRRDDDDRLPRVVGPHRPPHGGQSLLGGGRRPRCARPRRGRRAVPGRWGTAGKWSRAYLVTQAHDLVGDHRFGEPSKL